MARKFAPLSTVPVKLIYGAAAAMPGTFALFCQPRQLVHGRLRLQSPRAEPPPEWRLFNRVRNRLVALKPTINTATPSAIPMVVNDEMAKPYRRAAVHG